MNAIVINRELVGQVSEKVADIYSSKVWPSFEATQNQALALETALLSTMGMNLQRDLVDQRNATL
ncbi:UNVERIFIED_CONTAM: hypothetical protein RF653_15220 [Kocuria sp. CPCC 205316]|uniref:hypothetical protein n=1 Tax=Kocuria TaxID=57493 RepID=UPI0036DBD703